MENDELTTIPNVTLIKVGAWQAGGTSPGKSKEVVFTEDDLRNIIASMEAPDVKEPRMILGHTPGDEGPGMSAVADEGFFGEQPAIGKFTNCRLSTDGQEIIGDLAGVPAWLAKILPTAYSNRSVEVYWDVPSGIPGAPNHACIMPRVALLGTNLPAVATLEDLRVFFSEEGPEIPEPDLTKATRRVAAMNGGSMGQRAAASVQVEDVRREFYNSFATEASGRYWWYITAMYAEPEILIVDDEEESLWSVPYTVKGEEIEFGDPVEIKVQYVEKESGKVAAARMSAATNIVRSNRVLGVEAEQVYDSAAASRPDDRKPRKESTNMGIEIPALRERLGLTAEQLPDGATEEQINAALSASPPGGADGTEEDTEEQDAPETPPADEGEKSKAARSDTVTVDRAAWEESQRTTAALAKDLENRTKAERESKVVKAGKEGKFPPSRKDHYVKLMHADPEGTEALLDSMEAGVIPVGEVELGVGDDSESARAATSDYDLSWLTDGERARVEAARAGSNPQNPRIVLEG